jgi:putative membrane protein
MAEVEMARLAEKNASSPRVKEYARQLVEDHTKANQELKRIAANDNVALPANLDSSDRSELDKLKEMSGAKFDQEFMKHSVDDHKDDIKEFEKQADKGTDPAIKSFASNTLPKLRHHLEMAQTIHSNQKGNADRSSSNEGDNYRR